MKTNKKELRRYINTYFFLLKKMTKKALALEYGEYSAYYDFKDCIEYISKLSFIRGNITEKRYPQEYEEMGDIMESFYTLGNQFYLIMKDDIIKEYEEGRK